MWAVNGGGKGNGERTVVVTTDRNAQLRTASMACWLRRKPRVWKTAVQIMVGSYQ